MLAAASSSSIWGSSGRGLCIHLLLLLISSSLIRGSCASVFAGTSITAAAAADATNIRYPGNQKQLEGDGNVEIRTYLHPVYPGLDPVYESISLPRYLFRRDCSANGSNYCFGNSQNACPNCGNCCTGSQGKFCTPNSASICCGDGHCDNGETCENGQCAAKIATTTVTSTVLTTVTHFATALANVVVEVDVKSTTYETVVITTSNVDTATVVVYVTATAAAAAKRSAPTQQIRENVEDRELSYVPRNVGRLSSAVRRLVRRIIGKRSDEDQGPISPFAPRTVPAPWTYQSETPDTLRARDMTTVTTTTVVTSTADITSTVSATQTSLSTAVALVTNSVTQTSALNAKATITSTSTITQTPQQPLTQTHTLTTTIQPAATPDPHSNATNSSSLAGGPTIIADTSDGTNHTALPTPTVIGIAVGSAAGAALLAGVLFVLWRVRQRRIAAANAEPWYNAVPNEGLPRTPLPPPPPPLASPLAKYHHGAAGGGISHHASTLSGATTAVAEYQPYAATYQRYPPRRHFLEQGLGVGDVGGGGGGGPPLPPPPPPPPPPPRPPMPPGALAVAAGHGRNPSATSTSNHSGSWTRSHSYTGSQGTTAPLVEAAGSSPPPRRYEMDGSGGGGAPGFEGPEMMTVTPVSEGSGVGMLHDRTVSDSSLREEYTYRR